MRNFLLFLLCVFTTAITHAQQITGSIKDDQGKILQGATVALKKSKDSSIVKLSVTNGAGSYAFANIANGKYFINTSHVGYAVKNSPAIEVSGEGQVNVP